MSEIELVDSQINILLNLAYLEGDRSFTVHSPLLGLDLFEVELGRREWRCEVCHDREGFKDEVEEVRKKVPADLESEIPGYDSLRNVLVASGCYESWEFGGSVSNVLKKIKGNHGKYSICLDTNVFYNRFVSSVLDGMMDEFGVIPEFVLSNMVCDEIRKKANWRYDESEVEELGLPAEFFGQYKLESRKAKIALSELDYVDGEMRTVYHGDEDFVHDNEKRDIKIVKEYDDSSDVTGKKGFLFGFEYDFKEKVEGYDLDFVFLNYPEDLMDVVIGYENLYRVLRYSAQVYGVVELSGLGCSLYGVWDGVQDSDLEEGRVKLVGGLEVLVDEVGVSNALRSVM